MRYDARETDRDDAWDRDATRQSSRTTSSPSASDARLAAARQPNVPMDHLRLPTGRWHERVVTAEGRYRLRGSQSQTLAIVGTFRVARSDELPHYGADVQARDRDIRNLKQQHLIVSHMHPTRAGRRYEVLSLTERGAQLLETASRYETQRYHAGIVKPRELPHDLALYRMYRQEAGRLEAEGAHVRRLIIDAEITGAYHQLLNTRAKETGDARRGRQQAREEFATAHELPILNDHLQIPDMRIEYEMPDGEVRHVDLELITEHYSRECIAAKARAGFVIYRAPCTTCRTGNTSRRGAPDTESDLERLL